MKKTILIILVFLFVNEIKAQITERTFYDFCQCDYAFGIDSASSSNPMLATGNKSIKIIQYKGKIINFKEYDSPLDKRIKYEYTLLDADTFYFTEYDTLNGILLSGNMYFDRKQIRSDTTFVMFDADTYERLDDTIIHHFYQPVRHGNWSEWDGLYNMGGDYEHGKKQGIWNKFSFETNHWKELEFVNDSLIREEELNLVKKENVADEIIESLTKDILSLRWEKGECYIRYRVVGQRIKFDKDGTVRIDQHHDWSTYDWTYDDTTKTIKTKDMTFKIIWMMGDLIELKSIEYK